MPFSMSMPLPWRFVGFDLDCQRDLADGRMSNYSPPESSAALPPAAAVLTVTVCSVAKRGR